MVGAFFKNQGELVDCIPQLCQSFPGITIVFAGDDTDVPLVAPLKEQIARQGLGERVIFTGMLPRERIHDLFHDLDLSVSTFRNEGFGLVHLESLAAGTPVVTYDEGGQVDFLRQGGGVLVTGGRDAFARAVVDMLCDHERRFAMGRDGRALVERSFSLHAMGDAYRELFRELLAP
jgi:glycosyltransferase involved in cell wall biosynthesis